MIVNQQGEALYWSQNSSMGYSLQKNRWTHPFCDGKYSLTQEKSHRFESKNHPKINLSKVESQPTYQSPFSKPQNQEPCSLNTSFLQINACNISSKSISNGYFKLLCICRSMRKTLLCLKHIQKNNHPHHQKSTTSLLRAFSLQLFLPPNSSMSEFDVGSTKTVLFKKSIVIFFFYWSV